MLKLVFRRPRRPLFAAGRFTSTFPMTDHSITTISQESLIQSVADALQYISYYHPLDYIDALAQAYAAEESPAAKDAIAQILTNSRMSAEGHRPMCQDTGIVVVFVKIGMDVRWDDATMSITDMVNEGVRRAYLDPDNTLRASIVADPAGARKNTRDNTPAVVHFDLVPGNTVEVKLAAKEGSVDGADRHACAQSAWAEKRDGGASHRDLRCRECARHRCSGSGRTVDGARRQDSRLSNACGEQAGGHDSQLRGDPSCALHARWIGRGQTRSTRPRTLAGCALGAVARVDAGQPRHSHARGGCALETGRALAPERQDADRTRRRAQAHRGYVRQKASRCRQA